MHLASLSSSFFPHKVSLSSHSASMLRRHRMRCSHGRGRGIGSHPPLPNNVVSCYQPLAGNVAHFHFSSAINKPIITTTIRVVFLEEQNDSSAFGPSKRRRKSAISVRPPRDSRKSSALPVKTGSETSSSGNNGKISSLSDKHKQDTSSTSSSENTA